MSNDACPTIHVLAGPIGAGKTSLYEAVFSRPTWAEFVNADRLIAARLGRHPATTEEAQLGPRVLKTDEQLSEDEIARRRDEAVKRMIATPPEPRTAKPRPPRKPRRQA